MSDPLLYEYVDVAHRPATADALRERIERNATGKSPDGLQDWLGWVIKNESGAIVDFLTATIHQDGDAHIQSPVCRRLPSAQFNRVHLPCGTLLRWWGGR